MSEINLDALLAAATAYAMAKGACDTLRGEMAPLQKTETALKKEVQAELLKVWTLGNTETESRGLMTRAIVEVKTHLELHIGSTNARKALERMQPLMIGGDRELRWKFPSGPRQKGTIGVPTITVVNAPTFGERLQELIAEYRSADVYHGLRDALHRVTQEREQEEVIDILWSTLISEPPPETLDEVLASPSTALPTITRHRKNQLVEATASS